MQRKQVVQLKFRSFPLYENKYFTVGVGLPNPSDQQMTGLIEDEETSPLRSRISDAWNNAHRSIILG